MRRPLAKTPMPDSAQLPTNHEVIVNSSDVNAAAVAPISRGNSVDAHVTMAAQANFLFGWTNSSLRRALSVTLSVTLLLGFLWYVQSILPPFIIAFFLAALVDPSLRHLEKHGSWLKTRTQGIVVFYLLAIAFIVTSGIVIVPLAVSQVQEISTNLGSYYSGIQASANHYMLLHKHLLVMMGVKQTNINQVINDRSGPVQHAIDVFLNGLRSTANWGVAHFLWLVIIPVAGFFLMRDYPDIRARIIALFPKTKRAQIDRLSYDILDVFTAYLRGLTKICMLYSLIAFCLFEVLDVQYAVFLGLLAGLFYAVPYVGNLITAASAGAIAYLNPHSSFLGFSVPAHSLGYSVLVVASCISLANVVFDNIVYPRIVGGSVGLHPVVSIFSLAAGATLFGVWGMLLATPVAASIKIIVFYCYPRLAEVEEMTEERADWVVENNEDNPDKSATGPWKRLLNVLKRRAEE